MNAIVMLMLGLATLGPIAPSVWAQGAQGPALAAGKYDPRTVEAVSGEVVSVERVQPAEGRAGGVHLVLETDRERLPVHLGPAWYVDQQTLQVRRGDHVDVEGSRVSVDGKPAIIAREVKKDGQTLTLRNAAGVPAWSGRGRGRRRRSS